MTSTFQRQQTLLTERNLDCMLGDVKTTALLLLQAPIIASLIAWRFHNIKITTFLSFSLALSALWFGCTNAARELVKERAIFARERLFGLHLGAYLVAKLKVLVLLGSLQTLCLILLVNTYVPLRRWIGFHLINCFTTVCAGIAIGLLISVLVRSIHQADALVPLALIPQILFSPVIMPSKMLAGWAATFEKTLPLKWAYESFRILSKPDFTVLKWIKSIGILWGIIILLLVMVTWLLSRQQLEI
jgi:ABC-type multidrug transport system permease subunit